MRSVLPTAAGRHFKFKGCGAAALGAATLAGCVAGPNFSPPVAPAAHAYTSAPLPDLTRATQGRPQTTLPMPAEWWSLFGSSALDATIRTALTDNRTLTAARERLAEAQEAVGVAEAGLFPRVNLGATAGRVKYGPAFIGPENFPPFTFYSVGPSVTYGFDIAGGIRRGVERQRALTASQAEQLQAAALALSGNVAVQALAAASAQAQLDSLGAVLADDRRNLQLVQDAFMAGAGTRVDILNAQSQLANDETLLPPLRRQRSLAQDALALLVGQAPGQWRAPDFQLDDFHLPAAIPLAIPSAVAHRRPDIRAAEARLHAATAAVGVATANLYPQISITANASLESNVLTKLFNVSGIGAGLTGSLTAPLFDHGALRARRREAIDEMHAALSDYQQAVLSAFRQVADALQGLDQDQALLSSEHSAVQTAAQNLMLTRESFTAGNSGVLQVLDAQRQDAQARLGLVRAESQRLHDVLQLMLAIAGPLPPASTAP